MRTAARSSGMETLAPSSAACCPPRPRQRNCTDIFSVIMNKFLKKRATEAPPTNDDITKAPSSGEPRSPGLKKPSTSRWKKTKKPEPEPRPEVNIAITLPSSDDFRTSLIMPNLSARFSMLREQDDPNSKLGKASDDSVLQPRRRSRMNDFSFGMTGLDDIAEVSSLHGSLKPPFAQRSREASCTSEDGYGSDADAGAGNVMGRSRPGEGNSLFGGRQKVYKIATSGVSSTRSLGKQVYEDDLGKSAFQRYRQKEREFDESQFSRPSNESQGFDFGLSQAEPGDQDEAAYEALPTDSAKDLTHSPSFSAYDKKRSTTSSTARSDARSSTAATSIASQQNTSAAASPAHAPASFVAPAMSASSSQDRPNPKNRRLYDQGLDQHMQDQQNSALTRLNSIQQQRSYGGSKSSPYLHGTKSATNLRDRAVQPVYALRSQSPTQSTPALPQLNTLGSLRNRNRSSPTPVKSGPQSPIEDESDALTQALEPADRGKATAMGAFNKPAHAFDEQQYLERQQQLQRTNSSAIVKNKPAQQSAVQQRIDRFEHEGHRTASTPSPDSYTRARSNSAKHEPTKAYNVFQNAVNQFPAKTAPKPSASETHRTFFGDISASEDEDDEEQLAQSFNKPDYGYGTNNPNKWQPSILHPVSEHPALRSQQSNTGITEECEGPVAEPEGRGLEPVTSTQTVCANATAPTFQVNNSLDSPTLGPDPHEPLNGMVRHLRQRSNQSSVYPMDDLVLQDDDVPDVPEMPWTSKKSDSFSHVLGNALQTPESVRESVYSVSNPWDLDETRSFLGATRSDVGTAEPSSIVVNQQSDTPLAMDSSSDRLGGASGSSQVQEDTPSWQQELRKQHTRDASTATQQERDAFENELAARRNAIQERIKGKVEQKNSSRGTSPAPSSATGGLRAFGMLRAKTSRESLVNTRDVPPKAAKAQGITSATASNTSLHGGSERDGYSSESARSVGDASSRVPFITAQHPAFKQDGTEGDGELAKHERQLASSRPPLVNGRNRSRSNSTTTGRSRSRTGPYRDDLEKAMVEGTGSSALAQSVHTSPALGGTPELDGISGDRDSAVSKKTYFDAKSAVAYQQMYQQNSLRMGNSGSTTPVLSPIGFNRSTPPLSATTAPTGSSHTPIIPTNAVRPGQLHRKKTISKSDISEPTLISSTSNVDTVDLPEGASLKNGMDEPPPLPPMNPRRRGTRKLFGLGRTESTEESSKVVAPEHTSTRTSPPREYQFPPSNVVRMPGIAQSPVAPQNGTAFSPIMRQSPNAFSPDASPERVQRKATAPLDGGMF